MRACSTCRRSYIPVNSQQRYCSSQCRDRKLGRKPRVKTKTTTEAGYGYGFQKIRKQWAPLVERGEVSCWRCGRWIQPGTRWDLGHEDQDRSIIRGPEHARCNRSAGASKGNRQRLQRYTSSTPRIAR